MLRNGLSYEQASKNCNRLAKIAYDTIVNNGGSVEAAQDAAFEAYNEEMAFYEGKPSYSIIF